MRFSIAILLNRFINSEVILHEQDGKKVKGIFIPFQVNNIYTNRSGVSVYVEAKEIRGSKNENTHYLNIFFSKKAKEKMKSKGISLRPTIGYMHPVTFGKTNYGLVSESKIDNILNNDKE